MCAACGVETPDAEGLCRHDHGYGYDEQWAAVNRILCDFLHRKKVPARLTPTERDDECWAHFGEMA